MSLFFLAALLFASCGKSTPGHTPSGDSTSVAQAGDYYTCPMHPQVHSDKPGSCPICHMDLVKVTAAGVRKDSDTSAITMSDRGQSLANVATVIVRMEPIDHTIRAFGTLEIPEPNKTMISARFNGRIEKLHVAAVGASVKKGQELFDIYSPDIVQAENDYLQAYKSSGGAAHAAAGSEQRNGQSAAKDPMTLVSAARSKLQILGFTENQIRALESEDRTSLVFTYHSPASGIVVDKKIVEGMYITEGLPLFEISDLSTLWNIVDVYDADAGRLHVGDKATIQLQNFPDRTYPASVAFIYQVVNPQSRTIKVRLTVNNASGALRPNTYTETLFRQTSAAAITVPVTAVLITGKRNIVYVKSADSRFEPRDVGIGVRFDGKFEITRGLQAGDVVVSQGGYLIDSESQLKSGGGS